MIAAAFGLPALLFGPIFGAYLDRNGPRKAIMAGSAIRTLLTLALVFTTNFWPFLILVLAKSFANSIYWPSSALLTKAIVLECGRIRYFSNLSALDQICKVGAPFVCGLLLLAVPARRVFLLSVLFNLICLLVLTRLVKSMPDDPVNAVTSTENLMQNFSSGLTAISRLPRFLIFGMAVSIGMSFLLATYDPHLAAYLKFVKLDSNRFALLVFATAVGAVFAAVLVRAFASAGSTGMLIYTGSALFSATLATTAVIAIHLPEKLDSLLFPLWFLNGFGYELFVIGASVNFQKLCPPYLIGRVSTLLRTVQLAAVITGPIFGAWLIAQYGRTAPFLIAGLGAIGLIGTVLVVRRRRF